FGSQQALKVVGLGWFLRRNRRAVGSSPSRLRPGGIEIGFVTFFVVFSSDKVLAQIGRPGNGERKRGQQRHAHRNRQSAEKDAGYTGDRNKGNKHHNWRNRRSNQRHRNFPQSALNGLQAALAG